MKEMTEESNWKQICRYISGFTDLHKMMHPSAGWIHITDSSMTMHKITDKMTLERVKEVVVHIKGINRDISRS